MFIDYKCDGTKYVKSGSFEGIICPVDNEYCIYSGYCGARRRVRHTEMAKNCTKKEWAKKQQESANAPKQ